MQTLYAVLAIAGLAMVAKVSFDIVYRGKR